MTCFCCCCCCWCCCFFLSKSPGGQIYRRNERGAWNAKFHLSYNIFFPRRADVWLASASLSVCTDGKSYADVISKFSWMDRLPNFLSCGALLRCTKAPARSSAIITPQTAKNTRWPLWRNKKEQNFESSIARLQFTEFIRKCEVSKVDG